MRKGRGHQASISLGERDHEVVAKIRADFPGLAFNAAVRYALRLAWIDQAEDAPERKRRRAEVKHWLQETLAGRRPGWHE